MSENNKPEFVTVDIFKNSSLNYQVQLRWSAQKKMVCEIMTTDGDDNEPGINEIRSAIDHTFRIKLQSYVKDLAYEATDHKKMSNGKGVDYRTVTEELTEDQIETIRDKAVDWQYGTTHVLDKETKKIEKLDKMIDDVDPEVLLKMLAAKGIEVKQA